MTTPPPEDLRAAGAVLAAAFAADPLFTAVLPDARRRARVLPALFTGSLRQCRRRGGVALVGGGAGVAGWVDAAHLGLGPRDVLATGQAGLPLRFGLVGLRRFLAHESAGEHAVRAVAPPGAAYLWVLGVDPARTGTGLGRTAVAAALDQMAAAGHAACVLKTEQPRNLGLYEHLGFAVIRRLVPEATGLPAWVMTRRLGT